MSTGAPAEEIVRLAETRGANLIVMGLHSGGMLGPRMGAVGVPGAVFHEGV